MAVKFQSPSHRGGGAARWGVPDLLCRVYGVSIPFSSGRRRRRYSPSSRSRCRSGFNPLLIGEAAPPDSPYLIAAIVHAMEFQSPSHRGGGAADMAQEFRPHAQQMFQSPSHRGGGAAIHVLDGRDGMLLQRFNPLLIGEAAPPECPARRGNRAQLVSIPFSSGRRRRRRRGMACHVCSFLCFNPLLIGGAAPPMLRLPDDLVKIQVSIPFSSGRRRRPSRPSKMRVKFTRSFQSPSHRGGGAAVCPYTLEQLVDHCFNPLLIGEAAPPWRWSIV